MDLNTTRQDRVLAAIFTVCQEIPPLRATADNSSCGSSYTPLGDILKVVKPLMAKAGLFTTFTTSLVGNVFTVQMRIIQIDTGEIFGSELPFLIDTGSAHEIASLVTYARRYLLDAALNLELGCSDDDGQLAQRGLSNGSTHRQPQQTAPAAIEQTRTEADAPSTTVVAQEQTVPQVPKPIDPKIQEGIRMNNLWTRLKTVLGKPGAEKVLMDAVGTSYIKLVKPDQYAAACAALESKLAEAPVPEAKAA